MNIDAFNGTNDNEFLAQFMGGGGEWGAVSYFFFRPQFGLKIRRGGGEGRPLPWIRH